MASFKEIKSRIISVQNTRKITSAMKMVASAKLHKAEAAIMHMLPYDRQLSRILRNFLGGDVSIDSPYVKVREVKRVAIVVFSSNTSLCGAYNANVIKRLLHTVEEYKLPGRDNLLVFPVGRKVEEAVKKAGIVSQGSYQHLSEKPNYSEASALAARLMELFVSKEVDKIELIYHHFKSLGSQELIREVYLPINLEEERKKEGEVESKSKRNEEINKDYIVEPSVGELIADLLPTVLSQKLFTAAVDAGTSEHAARMLAMQLATDNANNLIHDLNKQYNKGRQQAITGELLDIIGASMI